ncbi:5-demethoxyubiquinone hydroxylase, mitochondrial (Fragment), partial [Geodia barretti]
VCRRPCLAFRSSQHHDERVPSKLPLSRQSSVWIRSNCYASTKEPRHASGTTCSTPAAAESSSRPRPTVDRMIRVNHAGEFGANRIYAGQISVLGDSSVGSSIKHMQAQERTHLELFDNLMSRRRVRPTLFLPLWDVAGFILGAGSAALGKEAAMACTVAVEEAVVEHYNSQLRELIAEGGVDEELLKVRLH